MSEPPGLAPLRNIVFDLGGVLFTWDPAAIVASVFDDPDLRRRARREVLEHDDWAALDRGTISEEEARRRFMERAGLDGDSYDRLRAATREEVTPLPGAFELLDRLRARGCRLFALSNISRETHRFLRERYDIWDRFSGVVTSSDEQCLKPEAAIFRRLLKRHGLKAAETLFIDDSRENVEGAEASGIRGMAFPGVECAAQLIDAFLDPRLPPIHRIGVRTIEGREATLREYAGRPMLIVNTASRCGFTRQYAGLEQLHKRYGSNGLAVLGFPSNSFLWQEPGRGDQIRTFCETRFGVSFPLFARIPVRGRSCHGLFRYLTSEQAHGDRTGRVTWNFNKFLVGGDGRLVRRFGSRTAPDDTDLLGSVEQALADSPGG